MREKDYEKEGRGGRRGGKGGSITHDLPHARVSPVLSTQI